MKRVFSFFAATVIILSTGMNSCTKDTAKPLEVDWNRTATVKGAVLVNSDVTKITSEQVYAAADITVDNFIVTIDYGELTTGASGTYTLPKDKILYNESDGTYTIVAPVGANGTTINVKVADFPGSLRKMAELVATPYDVVWKSSSFPKSIVNVMPGEIRYNNNILLDGNTSSHYSIVVSDGIINNTATLYGKLLILRDLTPNPSKDPEPAGISAADIDVTIPNSYFVVGQIGDYKVPNNHIKYDTNDGFYTIKIPLPLNSMTVSVKINDFYGTLKQSDGTNINVTWKASSAYNISSTVSFDDNEKSINLGEKILYGSNFYEGIHWERR